jgi:hypothetical protein
MLQTHLHTEVGIPSKAAYQLLMIKMLDGNPLLNLASKSLVIIFIFIILFLLIMSIPHTLASAMVSFIYGCHLRLKNL